MKISYKQNCYYTNYVNEYYKDGSFYDIKENVPKNVTIKPTLCCVAKCAHCSPRNKKFSGNKTMTLDGYDDLFASLQKLGTENICISGGEPLLYNDIISLVKLITKNNMKASLNTNGWLLNKNLFNKLMKAGLLAINISLDSPIASVHDKLRGLNGLFDKTVTQLKECKSMNIPFVLNIRMILSKYNYKDLEKMIDLAMKLDADVLSIDMIEADSKKKLFLLNEEELKLFDTKVKPALINKIMSLNIPDELKKINVEQISNILNPDFNSYNNYSNGVYWPDDNIKRKCDIPNSFLIIEGDGNVLPCNAVEYNRNKVCGNLFETDIKKLWTSDKITEFRDNKMDFCMECPMNMSFMIFLKKNNVERDVDFES